MTPYALFHIVQDLVSLTTFYLIPYALLSNFRKCVNTFPERVFPALQGPKMGKNVRKDDHSESKTGEWLKRMERGRGGSF